ncbi:MAG: hypothetical protein ACFFCT_08260 [Candidatus Odinarchaeota archaeon]
MKLNYTHAFALMALIFLLAAPGVAAANSGGAVIAQDIGEDFLFGLLENGAEVVFTAIGPQGEPAVIYGQLGIPSEELALSDAMYTDCMLMALVSTQGELLDYILDLVGAGLFNFSDGGGGLSALQFGEGGFDVNSIIGMLGTDFNLLINIFVNADDTEAQTNMASIKAHLNTNFGFVFTDLLDLRIDESFFPPDSGITLPFESLNIFISQVENSFEDAVTSVFSVMDGSGFLDSIDISVFTEARASGAGLIAIPDLAALQELIGGFGGETPPSATSFLISQVPELSGPLAVAFAGYIGDQLLSTSSTKLDIFEELLGKSPSETINGITGGQSLVVCLMPESVNVTSYSPEGEALNQTYYDNVTNMVFWNATHYSNQPDYTINFDANSFPPLVTFTREFRPDATTPGGSVDVRVAIHNEGDEAITNVSAIDNSIAATYESVDVTGTTSGNSLSIPAGEWLNFTYTVTFEYEGGYAFAPALMQYNFNGTTYYKQTHIDGYLVSPDPVSLLIDMFNAGMPFTGVAVGVIGLGAILNIALMARGRGSGGSYQV